ncbi:tetratricopeptide repeat protein [Dongia sedimenti]|uniref:Tetratricopeptide repeat protein n=1 Tax=Dongia sedimenti TaxID=3064282 RepID=A0ABU0YHG4_9PROT|nr:tetratricopeptide repeat protein [Rhodospirillaceae bacterium R-7]
MPTTYTINEAGLIPHPATPQPAPKHGPDDADLTLKSQHQRKVELAHEASLLNKAGRMAELKRCLEAIVEMDPNDAQALYNLGVLAYREDGDKAKAERLLRRAVANDPDYSDVYLALGDMHFDSRHLLSAIEIYEAGLRQVPTRLQLLNSLLRAAQTMRSPHRVEKVARRVLDIDEDDSSALNYLAWAIMMRDGDLDEADRALSRSLKRFPDAAVTLALVVTLAERRKEGEAAARHSEHLANLAARNWPVAHLAAETFVSVHRSDRAAEIVREFIKINPDDPAAHRYLAVALMQDGDFVGGHEVVAEVLKGGMARPSLQMIYALNSFRLGDLATFHQYHHTRWLREGSEKLWKLPVPEWDGSPIKHGKLLVQCEQGVGDYVMWAVLFPGIAAKARDVVTKAIPRMANVFRRSFPDMQFIYDDKLPPDIPLEAIAARTTAGDLLQVLGADIENLPGKAGVLVADPAMKSKLRQRYEALFPGKRLIGISWRSGNRDSSAMRSLELPYWKPLFDMEDCAFINLQYGDITRDLEELQAQLGDKVYWDKEINPMGDMDPFTAQISAMDMVISVDNSTVHFAGGLGKPCWAMLPLNSDWRWQTERTDTVWYDSLELFRPSKDGGWDGLVERVADRLAKLDDETLKQAEVAYLRRAFATMVKANRVGDAEQYGRMLLAHGVDKAQAMRAIAKAAVGAGQASDAVGILHRAIELDPEDPELQAEMAQALAKAGDADHGLALARDLTRRFPKNDEVSVACGRILSDLGRYDEATDFFARVLRRDPDNVASRMALAGLQAAQGDFELARKNYERVLTIEPSNATAHTALAEILLRLEQWAAGWPSFRWRYGVRPEVLPGYFAALDPEKQPKAWSEGGLRKQRLFLSAERNLIEQVLFAGLVPEVGKESRKTTLECDPRLVSLMVASFPSVEVLARKDLTPEFLQERNFQVVSTLGNLAGRLRATNSQFPTRQKALVTADPARVATLRQEYQATAQGRKLVGLSWRHAKTAPQWPTPLDAWLPLIDRPDVMVVALHPGSAEAELADFAERTGRDLIFDRRVDFSSDLGDYAVQVQACDIVIAVEDLTAVLAGAMGKPTIKLKRPVDHWWWGLTAAECRWFAALRTVTAPQGPREAEVAQVLSLLDQMRAG